eukprot:6109043-Amphidinium_carterae.1
MVGSVGRYFAVRRAMVQGVFHVLAVVEVKAYLCRCSPIHLCWCVASKRVCFGMSVRVAWFGGRRSRQSFLSAKVSITTFGFTCIAAVTCDSVSLAANALLWAQV